MDTSNTIDTRLANLEKMFFDLNESLKKKKKKTKNTNSDADSSDSEESTISKRSHKSVESSKSKKSTNSKTKQNRHCNKCSRDNHFTKECRIPKSKLICSHCNTSGSHLSKACLRKHKQKNGKSLQAKEEA
jgi:hypothetical protein